MDYTITLSSDGQYIIIKVTGDTTRTLTLNYMADSNRMGREFGIDKYFVDATESRNVASAFENYKLAYQDIPNTPDIDRLARVVILVSPDDFSHGFVEVVFRNTGLNVTLFTDREEAVCDLLGS